jgi:hypothetical protein
MNGYTPKKKGRMPATHKRDGYDRTLKILDEDHLLSAIAIEV